jgi:hypothetical protein
MFESAINLSEMGSCPSLAVVPSGLIIVTYRRKVAQFVEKAKKSRNFGLMTVRRFLSISLYIKRRREGCMWEKSVGWLFVPNGFDVA